jgi:hypothetical protein
MPSERPPQRTVKPSVDGTIPGAVWIADSSSQSPQVLAATGKGVVSVSLSPSSLNFGTVSKNTVSPAKTITVTNNNQSTAVSVTGLAVSGDYKITANACNGQHRGQEQVHFYGELCSACDGPNQRRSFGLLCFGGGAHRL